MSEDEAFLASLRALPGDATVRLAYADWLDERDDPRGKYLRFLCEASGWAEMTMTRDHIIARLQELRTEFAPAWLTAVQNGVGWRTLFESNLPTLAERKYGELYEFGPPATAEQLAGAEAALNVRLPTEVRELLSEFNGVWSTVGMVNTFRSQPQIGYLDIEWMTVRVPQYLRRYSRDPDNWHPPLLESHQVVFICQSNGCQRLWGVCTGDVAGHQIGEVVQLNPDVRGWEASHPNLAEFVRAGPKW